jgi:thiamine pyrophosphate-dependent acetolactate synthase large subunit-like protein
VKYSSSIEYADQTDEIIHEAIRKAMSGTRPVVRRVPVARHPELDVAAAAEPSKYRLVNQGPAAEVAEAAELIRNAKSPICWWATACTRRARRPRSELAELMACPVIQTSGGVVHPGTAGPDLPVPVLAGRQRGGRASDLCVALGTELGEPMHYGRTQHWAEGDANRKWVYVEQDPTAIGVNRSFDVALVGDLRGVVPQLVEALKESHAPRRPTWTP